MLRENELRDAVVSFVFCSVWRLLRDSFNVEAVSIETKDVDSQLTAMPGMQIYHFDCVNGENCVL